MGLTSGPQTTSSPPPAIFQKNLFDICWYHLYCMTTKSTLKCNTHRVQYHWLNCSHVKCSIFSYLMSKTVFFNLLLVVFCHLWVGFCFIIISKVFNFILVNLKCFFNFGRQKGEQKCDVFHDVDVKGNRSQQQLTNTNISGYKSSVYCAKCTNIF